MSFDVIRFFPTSVIKTNIGRDISPEELEVVKHHYQKVSQNAGNKHSNCSTILDEQLPEIKKFIEYGISAYVASVLVPASTDLEFYITQSWINYSEYGEFHHKHLHSNSIISGVFYITADPEQDKIVFYKNNHPQIFIEPKVSNLLNSDEHEIKVCSGDLIIFPSTAYHSVPTTSSTMRISLAFNVFAKGNFCVNDNLTKLKL